MNPLRRWGLFGRKDSSAPTGASHNGHASADHPPQAGTPDANGTSSNGTFSISGSLHSIANVVRPEAPDGAVAAAGTVRPLPRPALKWVGPRGRIALREFDFQADADSVCAFQEDTYTLNFPDFRYTDGFASAFRHDLRRAALDPFHGLFVLDEGEIIGFLWLVICQNTWTNERYGYVNNLYIASTRRSLGLGGELMQQSDAFFRSRRIKRVRLTVTAANESAVKLYERCGYTVTRWEMEKDV